MISVGTAIAFAGLVAVAAVVGTIIFRPMAGDEPSIRVGGGSIYLDLIGPGAQWEQIGSSDKWRVKGEPKRDKADYYYDISAMTGCSGPVKGFGKKAELVHSDGKKIDLEVKNKKTEVTGSGLELSNNNQTLSYVNDDESLKSIALGNGDGPPHCTFNAASEFKVMLLSDY